MKNLVYKHLGWATLLLVTASCASAEGTKPHDMSTAQHEAAAAHEEQIAEQDAAKYSQEAKAETTQCGSIACWTSTTNPTEQYKEAAERHAELAKEHRAAAAALRNAEESACAGIDEADRVTSPFFHKEDIESVSKAQIKTDLAYDQTSVFAGGEAVFRAVPGMTAQWLQSLVDCHQARAAAVGYSMPEMDYCPLVLKDVKATVKPLATGFAITVTSMDADTAKEIWRRMSALK